jgi:hypothetical protein
MPPTQDAFRDHLTACLHAPGLREQADVIRFREDVVARLPADLRGAAASFGGILESSLLHLVQTLLTGEGNAERATQLASAGLGKLVGVLREAKPPPSGTVLYNLDQLTRKRNYYSHGRSLQELHDVDLLDLQDTAAKMTHFLVWKYECWAQGRAEATPPAVGAGPGRSAVEESLAATRQLVAPGTIRRPPRPEQRLDVWGVASVKSGLHALTEVIADDASRSAAQAAATYPQDRFTLLVPLACDLRWRRGYRLALERVLKSPRPRRCLGAFPCEEVTPLCPVDDGRLSGEETAEGTVVVRIEGSPAVTVHGLAEADRQLVLEAVNGYGRLGRPSQDELSLRERVMQVPLPAEHDRGPLVSALAANAEALAPLLARWGMPGSEWLLAGAEGLGEALGAGDRAALPPPTQSWCSGSM